MVLAAFALTLALDDALAAADAHFARRAVGARGGTADPAEIQAALGDYRRALVLEADSIPARIGMLRALFFRGGFCGEAGSQQKGTFEQAKRLAEESVKRLDALAARAGGKRLEALRRIPGAGALLFWSAVAWGQWSLDHKLAAAWQGAAGRIRDLCETAIALDPLYEQGSPFMLLGRLHAESPRVPLVTNWISRKKALQNLGRAHEIAPQNSVAEYFLADAILDHAPARRAEAARILRTCATQQARPEYLVEDRHYAELCGARLSALER